jgi:hypothetical protein
MDAVTEAIAISERASYLCRSRTSLGTVGVWGKAGEVVTLVGRRRSMVDGDALSTAPAVHPARARAEQEATIPPA